MHKRLIVVPLFITILLGIAGCATIIEGSHQRILVASEPPGAVIFVNGIRVGKTPAKVKLRRGRHLETITISMPRYKTKKIILTRTIDGWFWGNILLGGVIGMVVDASTGDMYSYRPRTVNEKLTKDDLLIKVTKHPAPGMKKIGHLKPI